MNTDIKFSKAVNTLLNQNEYNIRVFSIIAKGNVDKYDKFLVFKRQGLVPLTSKDRLTHRQTATYDVNLFAKDYLDLLNYSQWIIDSLEHHCFDDVEGYQINNITLNDINEDFNDEYGLYVFTMTFDFTYTVKSEE